MRIGIVGGTGREGKGIGLRLARSGHEVFIGSRSSERGQEKAAEFSEAFSVSIQGGNNAEACEHGELIILTVPYNAHKDTLSGLKDASEGKILVDITVPIKPPKFKSVNLPEGQAAALEAQALLGDGVTVVAALHHISSEHLGDPAHTFDSDVLVCGPKDARATVVKLIADLGLRGIEAGVLKNAIALESLTPVLLFINNKYGSEGSGIRITGLPE